MRPIELKMTAFGPYQGTEVVDFTKLEDKNLFLITGPTGAGKTTIFDAISYALYGETSGSDRPEKSVKCQSAPLDTLCQVALSFELHGRVYKVLRIPTQEKLKSRGEGTTQHNAEAVLHLPGKIEPETGAKNVTEHIKKIIGLELNQFRQIMMIPQGEFRQLLMAKSDERTDILKQIFKTHLYGHLQDKFKAKSLELEKSIKNHLQKKEGLCHQIELIGEDDNSLLLREALRQEFLNVSKISEYLLKQIQSNQTYVDAGKNLSAEIKKLLEAQIIQKEHVQANNENLKQLKLLEEKIEALEKSRDLIEKDRTLLKSLEAIIEILPFENIFLDRKNEIEIKEDQEKNLVANQEKLLVDLEALKKDKAMVTGKDFTLALEDLKDSIKKYDDFQDRLLGLKTIDGKIALASERLKKEKEDLESLNECLHKHSQVLESLEGKIKGKDDLKDHIHSLENTMDQKIQFVEKINEIKGRMVGLRAKEVDVQNTLKLLNEKEALMLASEKVYKNQKRQYFLNQAALLARDLEPDMPCPVCGSKDHVALAAFQGQAVSEDQLKAYEDAYDQEVLKFRAVENKYSIVSTEYKQGHEGLQADFEKLFKEDGLKSSADDLEKMEGLIISAMDLDSKALLLIKDDLDLAYKNLKVIEESIEEKNKLEREQKDQLEKVDTLKESLQSINLDLSKLETQRQAMVENIPKNLQDLKILVETREKTLGMLRDKVSFQEGVLKDFEVINRKWIQLTSSLESLQALILDLKNKATTAEEVFKKKLTQRAISLEGYESLKAQLISKDVLEKRIYTYDQNLHSHKETHKHLKKALKYDQIKDLEPLEKEIEALKIKERNHEDKMNLLNQNIKHNSHLLDQMKALEVELKKYESEYYNVGKISKVINGKNSRNMTFEGYILAIYLKDILQVANHRLMAMTYNRYQLKVSDTLMDKRGTGGLDLEVYDAYTGLERSVKTLSGGESFKASLAMALGLAEVVQSYAGGIALDTVFIDEGFGTLDQSSLDTAINCLVDLQDSGRLVGIISHVQELKERIKTQLVITSEEGSSTTSFIVD